MIEAGGLTAQIEALQKEREEMARKDAEFSQARKHALVQLENEKARYGRYVSAVNEEEYLRKNNPAYTAYLAERERLATKVQDLERRRDEYRASVAREREKLRADYEARKAANPNYGLSIEQLYSAQGGGAADRAYAAEQERKRTAEAAEQVQSERASRAAEALSGGVPVQPRTQAATSYNIAVQEIKSTQAKGQDITDAQRMKLMEAAGAFGIDAPEKFVGKESYPEGTKFDYTINLAESLGMSADTGRPAPSVIKSPDMDMVTPQRPPRKKAQTGVQDRLYLAPGFVTEEEQKRRDEEKAKLAALGVTPGTSTILSLTEGFGGDRGERFSLGELEDLTAEQVAEYQKVYALAGKVYEMRQKKYFQELYDYSRKLKRQGVDTVPIIVNGQTIFVKTERLAGEMKKALQKDPNARISGFIGLEETLAIKTPQMGATGITQDEQGRVTTKVSTLQTPPPTPPSMYQFTPLSIKDGELSGLGMIEGQPALVTIDTRPQASTPEGTSPITEAFDRMTGFVEERAQALEKLGPLGQFPAELIRDLSGVYPSLVNVATAFIIKPAAQVLTQSTIMQPRPLNVPLALSGVGISGLGATAQKIAPITPLAPLEPILKGGPSLKVSGADNSTQVIQDASQTFESEFVQPTSQYVSERGLATIPAAVVAAVLPGGGKLAQLAPVRVVRIAPIVTGEARILARAVKLGYGQGVSRFEIGRIAETGKYFIGIPKPKTMPSLARVGFESAAPRGGYPITEDVSRYMYRPEVLKELVAKGRLAPDEAELIIKERQALGITGKLPDEVIRTTLPSQPVKSLEPGKAETGTFFGITQKRKLGLYGSLTEAYYMAPKYLEMARDVDIKLLGKKAGEKAVKFGTEIGEAIQKRTRTERQFFVKVKKDDVIDLATGQPTGKKEIDRVVVSVSTDPKGSKKLAEKKVIMGEEGKTKVSELIVKSPEAATREGFKYTSMGEVLGYKVPTKMKQVKTVIPDAFKGKQKITVFRRQELRRSSAMMEIQPRDRGGVLRPDPGREKEFTKRFGQLMTRAEQAERLGMPREAQILREQAQRVRTFAEKRGLWREGLAVREADESGVIIPESRLEKASSILSEAKPSGIAASISAAGSAGMIDDLEARPPTPPADVKARSVLSKVESKGYGIRSRGSAISRLPARTQSSISKLQQSESRVMKSKIQGESRTSTIKTQSKASLESRASRLEGISKTAARPSRLGSAAQSKAAAAARSALAPSAAPSKIGAARASPLRAARVLGRDILPRPAPTPKVPMLDMIKSKRDRERKLKEAESADFLGQAFVSDVVGFAKRKEITYGRKRTAQLVESDIRLTGKRYGSFSRTRNISVLSKSRPGVIKKFKKEKEFRL